MSGRCRCKWVRLADAMGPELLETCGRQGSEISQSQRRGLRGRDIRRAVALVESSLRHGRSIVRTSSYVACTSRCVISIYAGAVPGSELSIPASAIAIPMQTACCFKLGGDERFHAGSN